MTGDHPSRGVYDAPMFVLLALGAAAGLYFWKQSQKPGGGAECAALEAELEGIEDMQYQIVANIAATTDPAHQAALAAELAYYEKLYNEKATAQAAIAGCDARSIWESNL